MEPGLGLDPTSYAAKAMQRKRKEPPTETEVLSTVRKRPTTPPQEGDGGEASVSLEELMEAVGTPPSAAAVPRSQGSTPGDTHPMDVSQPLEQLEQED